MDISKIEKLLATIAKGDKTTLNAVIELLSEVASYQPKKMNEQRSQSTQVVETRQNVLPMIPSQRASMLMEGDFSGFSASMRVPQSVSQNNFANDFFTNSNTNVPETKSHFGLEIPSSQRAPDFRPGLSNDFGMQNHAGSLL